MQIIIISLLQRKNDRLILLIEHLEQLNFDYSVFKATKLNDGKLGLLVTVADLFRQLLKDTSWEYKFIAEDDMRFLVDDPKAIIKKCLEQLPEDFDMLYLGCNLWQTVTHKYSENLIQLSDSFATHSILYSRKGMKKVLEAIHDISDKIIPLDILIKEKIMPDDKTFCSFPNLTTQINSYSDIENKYVDYNEILEKRFEQRTAHLKNNLVN